jgi:hypothetical protein
MDDLTPVKGPSNPFEGRSAKVMGLVIVFLLLALIKPWGNGEQTAVLPPGFSSGPPATPAAAAVAVAASPTPFDPFANYDHEIFGVYEPEPRWELWPAGYLVSFGYAIRIESTPSGAPSSVSTGVTTPAASAGPSVAPSSARPSASVAPGVSATPPASASGAPVGDEPLWPATIRITHGNELAMIGVNMPLGYRVTGIGIVRTTGGADESLPVTTPASDWPSHFTVIALADANGGAALDHWPPGDYRLELTFEPDHIVRTIGVEIEAPTTDEAGPGEPAPSESPGPS